MAEVYLVRSFLDIWGTLVDTSLVDILMGIVEIVFLGRFFGGCFDDTLVDTLGGTPVDTLVDTLGDTFRDTFGDTLGDTLLDTLGGTFVDTFFCI